MVSLIYPSLNYFATSLRQGYIPFWTPYVCSGMPFMAVALDAFYPINWISPLFVKGGILPFAIVEILVIFHILLGGFFTYLYTKEIKLSNFGALISALTFMLSGFLITHSIHFLVNTFAWLPLILLFIHKSLTSGKYIYSILGGVFFGISILAGFPQFTLHISYIIVLYILFYAIGVKRAEIKQKGHNYIFTCLIVVLIGYGIAAIQYIPSYEYSKYTTRASISYEQSTFSSIPPLQLITLLIPKFFGSRTGMGTDSVPFWFGDASVNFWETCIYIGILPLIFMFFAFREKREKITLFFGGMAILSLLATLGGNTLFYKFIYYILPGFNKFRIPGRFSGIFSFSMAILAGFGADAIFRNKLTAHESTSGQAERQVKQKLPKYFVLIIAATVLYITLFYFCLTNYISPKNYTNMLKQNSIFLFFLFSSLMIVLLQVKTNIRPNILKAMSVVILFADLYTFGHNFNASNKNPYGIFADTPLTKLLQEKRKRESFRVNMAAENRKKSGDRGVKRNAGNIYRIELIEGYSPLALQRYQNFNIPLDRKLDLLNVKYRRVLLDEKIGQLELQENSDYLPRAFVVFDYVLASNGKEVLKILSDEKFDYKNKIVLEEKPDIDLRNVEKQDYHSDIDIHRNDNNPNVVSLHLSTDAPAGLLVFSDIYYPAWKAYVNGKRTKVYCADYALRAVCIGKGESEVKLIYDSTDFKIGAVVSLLTILIVITSLVCLKVSSVREKKLV